MSRKFWERAEWLISRSRINSMFEAGMAYPFVTVVAAPGYGKSTAAMDYAGRSSRKLIHQHLLPIDNDPDCFWNRAIEAARVELPELAEAMGKARYPETLSRFYFFLNSLTKILFQGTEVLLVYDSAENIKDERVLLFINSLIRAELENLCIIYISNVRSQPGPMVASGRHLQIGPAELRFNQQETMQLFKQYGRPLDDDECARLLDLTGGWPLALHLMASHPSNEPHHSFGETPHFHVIAELFHMNYFLNYDPEFRSLLVKLSFFDDVPLGLIQAVSSGDITETIDRMTHNIFISYDYSQGFFYFHNMYRDFLKQKRCMLSEEEKNEVYSKAGDWFFANRSYLQALMCYWEGGDYDKYLNTLGKLPQKRRNRRAINMVLEQLDRLPDEYVLTHDNVDLHRGLLLMNNLEFTYARKVLLALTDRLERQEASPAKQAILREAYMALIEVAWAQNSLESLEYARKALSYASDGARANPNRAMIVGNKDLFFLPDNAPGRLESMFDFVHNVSVLARQLYDKSGRGFYELFAAEASFYAQRFDEASEWSAKSIFRAREAEQHDIVLNGFILQLRMALFLGNYAQSEETVSKIIDYARQIDMPEMYSLRDYALTLFRFWLGDCSSAPSWLAVGKLLPTDIPMDIGRDRIAYAFCRFAEGGFEAAYSALLELDGILQEHKLWCTEVTSHILKAACLQHIGNKQKAIQNLWAAYDMTWRNNIIISFALFGKEMEALIDTARSWGTPAFDARWLDDVQAAAAACARRQSAMQKLYRSEGITKNKWNPDTLTSRELEVMRYLANGLIRSEISSLLGISLHGVKKHITSIYSKLGAVNRVEAVHIAKTQGLLE